MNIVSFAERRLWHDGISLSDNLSPWRTRTRSLLTVWMNTSTTQYESIRLNCEDKRSPQEPYSFEQGQKTYTSRPFAFSMNTSLLMLSQLKFDWTDGGSSKMSPDSGSDTIPGSLLWCLLASHFTLYSKPAQAPVAQQQFLIFQRSPSMTLPELCICDCSFSCSSTWPRTCWFPSVYSASREGRSLFMISTRPVSHKRV